MAGKNTPNEFRLYDSHTMSVNEMISRRLSAFTKEELYIGLPARVTSIADYSSLQCVNVETLFCVEDKDGQVNLTVAINKVFVKLQHGNGFSIELPIAVGDLLTLQWSHTALSYFLDSDGEHTITLSDFEKWQGLRDCWAVHGFGTRRNNLNPSTDNLNIKGDGTTITITPSGEITIVTEGNFNLTTPANVNISCAVANVTAGDSNFSGNVNIGGDLNVDGMSSLKSGTLSPTYSGYGGAGSMTIGSATISEDAEIAGISFNGHIHIDAEGRSTTTPQ